MTNYKQIFAALALVAAASSVAVAQSDFGSPLGAGGGLGGSVAPLGVPGAAGSGTARGLTGPGITGLQNARAAFASAGANGASVRNPAGGNSTVPQGIAQALASVLAGNPNAGQRSAVVSAVGTSNAEALVDAVSALGANQTIANLTRAINAYNAAIDALPAGQAPSPALIGIRQALFAASQQ